MDGLAAWLLSLTEDYRIKSGTLHIQVGTLLPFEQSKRFCTIPTRQILSSNLYLFVLPA